MAMLKREVRPNYKQSILSKKDIEAAQKSVADAVNMAANKSQRFEFCRAKIRPLLRIGHLMKSISAPNRNLVERRSAKIVHFVKQV